MENEKYFAQLIGNIVIEQISNKHKIPINYEQTNLIEGLMVKEYMNEFYGRVA